MNRAPFTNPKTRRGPLLSIGQLSLARTLALRVLLALFGLVFSITPAQAQSSHSTDTSSASAPTSQTSPSTSQAALPSVVWPTGARRFSWIDGSLTLAFGTTLVVSRVIGPPDDGPRGGIWFDESIRDALRSDEYRGRLRAADISDVLLGFSMAYALLGDPLVNAAYLRDSPDVGLQIGLLNSEVLAITLGTQQLTANLVGRERPYGRTCGTDELDEDTHSCKGRDRYRSFFSGHTSVPHAMAAATCMHHIYLPLSGNKTWLTCSLGFATAIASGTLRIVSDNHYATDVLSGAVVGLGIGFLVPFVHYSGAARFTSARVGPVHLRWAPTPSGFVMTGVF